MSGEGHGTDGEGGATHAPASAPPRAGAESHAPQKGEVSGEGAGVSSGTIEKATQQAVRRELRLPEWIMAIFTVAIFVATAANVIIARRQWHEMHTGGIDTHALAVATGQLVIAGQSQATSIDRLRKAGEAQAQATENLRVAAEKQAAATVGATEAARQANHIASEAGYSNLRPWIGLNSVATSGIFPNQDYVATVDLTNSGHSPALHARAIVQLSTDAAREQVYTLLPCGASRCHEATVLPGSGLSFRMVLPKDQVTPTVVDGIKAGRINLMVHFRVEYSDVQRKNHLTAGCEIYSPQDQSFSACANGNSAD